MRFKHGTTPSSKTSGCRCWSASRSYAISSSGHLFGIRALRNSVDFSSVRRCRNSRSGSTPFCATRAILTLSRRRSSSWEAFRTTFASTWRCGHRRAFRWRCTWHDRSSCANSIMAMLPSGPQQPARPLPLQPTVVPGGAAQTTTAALPLIQQFCRLTPAEQQERHRQGLCFNCDEPFVCGHQCKRFFYLESGDFESADEVVEEPLDAFRFA
jgi:hypothetical protein